MNLLAQFQQFTKNLAGLGQTRLIALAAAGIISVAIVIAAAMFVNKPAFETLYVNLEAGDLNQVSMALAETNMPFEVGGDGKSIQVPVGTTSKARLMLAERGLPNSHNAGYELFDNVGSLGLTSFMQEVTRVRALEGEIGRSIQQISGVSAARVHIVMPDVGNFRRGEQKPTASVMIRAASATGRKAASSIRHLVASAVPGLDVDDVTILDSTGQLLASGDDLVSQVCDRRNVEDDFGENLATVVGHLDARFNLHAALRNESLNLRLGLRNDGVHFLDAPVEHG